MAATFAAASFIHASICILAVSSMSDRASKALAEGFLLGERRTYDAISNVKRSLSLPSIIVPAGDAREKRKLEASSISLPQKRKLSKGS
jgi:hypothetical protein